MSTIELLRRLAAECADLPPELVHDDSRLLEDLHLSSITVGEMVNRVARELGISAAAAPTNVAAETVRGLAKALDALARTFRHGEHGGRVVAGVEEWARPWALDFAELAGPAPAAPAGNGAWQVYADPVDPLATTLRSALEQAGVGAGVLVCLPRDGHVDAVELALTGAKAALAGAGHLRFVLVQRRRGAAGLAKTLHLEAPHVRTTVVYADPVPETIDRVVAEVAATTAFSEVCYDAAGVRRIPTLHLMPARPVSEAPPLTTDDVLLATGGGKGITAECALALAEQSSCRLGLIGRADPAEDPELATNLARIGAAGITVRYARADVTDAAQVQRAITELEQDLGPITGVLHGAGRHEATTLTALSLADVRSAMAPKVGGLRAVLDAVDPGRLRLLVAFGSIIGRSGLRGEAHGAIANEWLAELTAEHASRYPNCRTLCLEWSVWSGVGVGERPSVVGSRAREAVTPITRDRGVQILQRLVSDPHCPRIVVVSGRTEGIHTIRYDRPDLPVLRFVSRPLIWYPGVELVTETELNAGTDLYLPDHRLGDKMLLPAVFGLEAMAQVAAALTGEDRTPVFEQVRFVRPIVIRPGGAVKIRVAALAGDDNTVDVVVYSEETNFAARHFLARLRYGDAVAAPGTPDQVPHGLPTVPLDPAIDLYGSVLFQGDRFQRLRRYHRAAARDVDADLAIAPGRWFAGFLPDTLLLGDPGVRDALMHGNQVCVPDATLLPFAIDRLYPAGRRLPDTGEVRSCAAQRRRDGDTYTYDIALRAADGQVVERWEGLRLRAVGKSDGRGPWVPPLLGPYLERVLGDLLEARLAVAVEPDLAGEGNDKVARRERTALAAARAIGRPVEIRYRPDGRPEVDGEHAISAAHGAGLTLCVAGPGAVGCDVEAVAQRPEAVWRDLLGRHAALPAQVRVGADEDTDTAATRVWTAVESLGKSGSSTAAPLALVSRPRPGWAVFASGARCVATFATAVRGVASPVVFALLPGHVDDNR
ncbi:MAG: SDR family NAD(P)-dependent oxidoreductase [Micromonosporaceae bacterium]